LCPVNRAATLLGQGCANQDEPLHQRWVGGSKPDEQVATPRNADPNDRPSPGGFNDRPYVFHMVFDRIGTLEGIRGAGAERINGENAKFLTELFEHRLEGGEPI
jgi:hypothetical protein